MAARPVAPIDALYKTSRACHLRSDEMSLVANMSLCADFPDYYRVLGVTKRATPLQIKRAYRTRVKSVHPDVNPSIYSRDLFIALNEAYSMLRDPLKRSRFDLVQDRRARTARRRMMFGSCCAMAAVLFGALPLLYVNGAPVSQAYTQVLGTEALSSSVTSNVDIAGRSTATDREHAPSVATTSPVGALPSPVERGRSDATQPPPSKKILSKQQRIPVHMARKACRKGAAASACAATSARVAAHEHAGAKAARLAQSNRHGNYRHRG